MVRFDAGLKEKNEKNIWVYSNPKLVFKQVLGVGGLWNLLNEEVRISGAYGWSENSLKKWW